MSSFDYYLDYDERKRQIFVPLYRIYNKIVNAYSQSFYIIKKLKKYPYKENELEYIREEALNLKGLEDFEIRFFTDWIDPKAETEEYMVETIIHIETHFDSLTKFIESIDKYIASKFYTKLVQKCHKTQRKLSERIEKFRELAIEFEENEKRYNERKQLKHNNRNKYNEEIKSENRKEIVAFKDRLREDNRDFKIIFIVFSFIFSLVLLALTFMYGKEGYLIAFIGCLFLPILFELRYNVLLIFLMLLNFVLEFVICLPLNLLFNMLINSWLFRLKRKSVQFPIISIPIGWIKCIDRGGWIQLGLEVLRMILVLIIMAIGILPYLLIDLKIISVGETVSIVFACIAIFSTVTGLCYIINSQFKEFVKTDKETYKKAFNTILAIVSLISIIIAIISLKK